MGAGLRFHGLGSRSLVGDEIASLAIASGHEWHAPVSGHPVAQTSSYQRLISLDDGYVSQRLVSVLTEESQLPVYFFLLNLWLHLFGTSESALRSLSVVAGLAAIPGIYALGQRIVSRNVGVYAAMMLAVAPFQIAFAQFARPYTLMLLLAVVTTLLAIRLGEGDLRARWFAGYGASVVLGLYTHYLFFWNVLFQAAYVAWRQRRNPRSLLPWAATLACSAGIFALWVPTLINQVKWNRRPDAVNWSYWISGMLAPFDVLLYIGRDLALFLSIGRLGEVCGSAGTTGCFLEQVITAVSYAVPILMIGGSVGLCLWQACARSGARSASAQAWAICAVWAACIFAGTVALDAVMDARTIKLPHHVVSAAIPLYLFVATSIDALPRPSVRPWVLCAFLLFMLTGSLLYAQGISTTMKYEQGFRQVARQLDRAASGGDLVLVPHSGLTPLNLAYYLRSSVGMAAILDGTVRWDHDGEVSSRLARLAFHRPRVWLLDDRSRESPRWVMWFRAHCREIADWQFTNLSLLLWADCRQRVTRSEG
jgi:hypothetical protein